MGRAHFERALELSGGKNLMVYVLYAKYYARLLFDRALHDRLLTEALNKDPEVPGVCAYEYGGSEGSPGVIG